MSVIIQNPTRDSFSAISNSDFVAAPFATKLDKRLHSLVRKYLSCFKLRPLHPSASSRLYSRVLEWKQRKCARKTPLPSTPSSSTLEEVVVNPVESVNPCLFARLSQSLAEIEARPHMDAPSRGMMGTIVNSLFGTSSERSSIFTSEIKAVDNLADALRRKESIDVNMPDVARLNETAESIHRDGIKIQHEVGPGIFRRFLDAVSGQFSSVRGFLGGIFDVTSEEARNALILVGAIGLELIRLKMSPENKWYNWLAVISFALCMCTGNDVHANFAMAYYGTMVAKTLWYVIRDWMTAPPVEEDEESEAPAEQKLRTLLPAQNQQTYRDLAKAYADSLITAVTGLKDYLTVRNVLLAVSSYRVLATGLSFTFDSIINFTMDFLNLLGSPFGITLFRKAYTRYPKIYDILDGYNNIKNKLNDGKSFEKSEVDHYYQMRSDMNMLDLTIPINHDNQVYRTALAQLKRMSDELELAMRSKGLLGTRRRKAPWSCSIAGEAGTAKTRIVEILNDIMVNECYSPDFYRRFKETRDAHVYSMKAGKKYMDGYNTSVKFVTWDDLGQCKKATDPECCPFLQLVHYTNNEPQVVNKAAVSGKDNTFYEPDMQFITTNRKIFDPDTAWVTNSEAAIRRLESNNGCVYAIMPIDKYTIKDAEGSWGYRVTAELKAKVQFDPEAFFVRRLDFRSGKFHGKPLTWFEFVHECVMNYRAHDAQQTMQLKLDAEVVENPTINPFVSTCAAKAHMDKPTPFMGDEYRDLDLDSMSAEDLRAILKAKKKPELLKPKALTDFDTTAEFIDYVYEQNKHMREYYYQQGHYPLANQASAIVWGQLNDYKWANFAATRREEINKKLEPVYDYVNKKFGYIPGGKNTMTGLVEAYDPAQIDKMFKQYMYAAVDIAHRFRILGQYYAKDVSEMWDLLFKSNMKIVDIVYGAIQHVKNSIYFTAMTLNESFWIAANGFFSFRSPWLEFFMVAVPGIILAYKATEYAADPHGDYQKMGQVLKDPLAGKCKTTKAKKTICKCDACAGLREKHQVKAEAKFAVYNQNMSDMFKSIVDRNVWNVQARSDASSTAQIHAVINVLSVSSRLHVTNHHMVYEMTRMLKKYPSMIWRFSNTKGTRCFDVLFRDMRWHHDIENDKSWFINEGLTSFGGGIRDISHMFMSEGDPCPTDGRICLIKYDRERGIIEYDHAPVKIGQGMPVYTSRPEPGVTGDPVINYRTMCYMVDIGTSQGHCGAPVITSDSRFKHPKIIGIIAAGTKESAGKCSSFVRQVTREEIERVRLMNSIEEFDTFMLPMDVVEHEAIPNAFIVNRVMEDPHTVALNNPIQKTRLYGTVGPCDRIPAFVAPWKRDDGVVFDPLSITRKKYATNGPAINQHLYTSAIAMLATGISHLLPTGPRAFRLTTKEALEGANDESRISTTSSPGGKYILQGIKKSDIVTLDGDQLDFSSPQGIQFLADVDAATKRREQRVISCSYINEFAKGECLSREKVYNGKVRLICGEDADEVIADKKELACMAYLLKKVSIGAGILIGFDPNSSDAHVMAMILRVFNRIIPGDYGGWDTTFFRYKYQGVLLLMKILLHDASPVHWRAITTCVENMLYRIHLAHIGVNTATMEFVKELVFYEWPHGMVSGAYSTLLFNCIANAIDVRYAVLALHAKQRYGVDHLDYDPSKHPQLPLMDIEKNLVAFVLGDDDAISVSPMLDYVTFDGMRNFFAAHNMKFTTDKKDEESIGYLSIKAFDEKLSDFTFCKRAIRWCPEYSQYVHVLAMESLMVSIYYSEDFREYEQVVDCFFRELSKYGREHFERYAPNVHAAALSEYGYHSLYSIYELALASIVKGVSTKTVRKLFLAIEEGALEPEEALYLESWEKFDPEGETLELFHGTNSSVVVNPVSMTNSIRPAAVELELPSVDAQAVRQPEQTPVVEASAPVENDTIHTPAVLRLQEVEAEARMDAPLHKEHLATTTMVAESEIASTSMGPRQPVDSYSHDYSGVAEFLKRPFQVDDFSWTTAALQNAVLGTYNISDELLVNKTWMNKISGYSLVRGTAVIRVQINANVFQQGKLLVHFIPQYQHRYGADSNNLLLIQKTQQVSVDLDCRDTEAILRIPYISPTHYFNILDSLYDWGTVFVTVLAPLRTDPLASSANVQTSVWLSFEDFEVAGPIPAYPYADFAKEEAAVCDRPLSTALKKAGKVASSLSKIPVLSAYATPVAWAADVGARLAYTMGYAKPQQNDNMTYVTPGVPNRYSATSDGVDTSVPLSLSMGNRVQSSVGMSGRKMDEMSFDFLKKVECLWSTIQWTTSTPAGNWQSIPLSLSSFYAQATVTSAGHSMVVQSYAPITYMSKFFQMWRGGLKLKIKFSKTTLVSGRLEIIYTPGAAGYGTAIQNMAAMREIVDIRLSNEVIMDLPWLLEKSYISPADSYGTLVINVINTLQVPSACSTTVDMLLYISGADDLELANPTPGVALKPVFAIPHSDIIDNSEIGGQTAQPDNTKFAVLSSGEFFTSVKQLIMRYTQTSPTSTQTFANRAYNPYHWPVVSLNVSTGARVAPTWGGSILPYMASMYASYRGGMRVGVNVANNTTTKLVTNLSLVAGSRLPNTAAVQTALDSYSALDWSNPATSNFRPGQAFAHVDGAIVYAKVPYFSDCMHSMVQLSVTDLMPTTGDTPNTWVNVETTLLSTQNYLMYEKACDDDFSFGYFVSVPLLAQSYT